MLGCYGISARLKYGNPRIRMSQEGKMNVIIQPAYALQTVIKIPVSFVICSAITPSKKTMTRKILLICFSSHTKLKVWPVLASLRRSLTSFTPF